MIYSFLYVFVFSASLVLIQQLDATIPPLFSLVISSTVATLYFNIINIKSLKKIYAACLLNFKSWLVVMFLVLMMWGTTITGPGKIGASLFNFTYFAWLGALGYWSLCYDNWKIHNQKLWLGLALAALIIINSYISLVGYAQNITPLLNGLALALIGGTFSFIYFKESKRLAKDSDLTATQILAVRFYLAIIVFACFVPMHKVIITLRFMDLAKIFLLSFFSLIIPLYFSQKALEKISSEQHAIINSLCPILTAIIQQLTFHDLYAAQMAIYFCYFCTLLFFYFLSPRRCWRE